jgi:ligand-binding sensor domain-containing protein/two-component sensor histidine kinase
MACTKLVQAQNAFNYYTITEKDGLPDNEVKCVAVDGRGWLWVGTVHGISCINGSSIKTWKTKQDGLSSPDIFDIFIDTDNTVWVCNSEGVYQLLPNQTKWKTVVPKTGVWYNCFFAEGENIWLGTGNGVVQLNKKTFATTQFINNVFTDTISHTYSNRITSIAKGAFNNTLLVLTNAGFFELNIGAKKFSTIQIPYTKDKPYYTSIAQLDATHWMVNAWGINSKLLTYTNGSYIAADVVPNIGEPHDRIYTYSTNDGSLYVQNGNSYLRYDSLTATFSFAALEKFKHKITTNHSTYLPQQQKLVLATPSQGLLIVDVKASGFHHTRYASNPMVTSQSITLQEWNNELMVGAGGNYFLQTFAPTQLLTDSVAVPTKRLRNALSCMSAVPINNNQCLLTSEMGIAVINKNLQIQKQVSVTNDKKCSLPVNFIPSVYVDSKHRNWIFPWRRGIWQADDAMQCFTLTKDGFLKDNLYGVKKLVVADAKEDKYGNMWFADLDEGLIYWDATKNEYSKPLQKQLGERWHLGKIIYQHPLIWINYEKESIVSYNIDTKEIKQFAVPPLYIKKNYDFEFDGTNLWIATTNGLLSFNTSTHVFQKFTEQDGLLHTNVDATLAYLSNGQMVIAQQNFLTFFKPKEIADRIPTPKLQLSLLQGGDSVYTNTAIANNYIRTLPYNKNNITIEWAVADFALPFSNNYYYRMGSKDSTWRYAGNKGLLNLSSLSSGDYTIELWAANSRGVYTDKPLLLHLTVKPPFWLSWWFIILVMTILSTAVYYFVKRRIHNIRKAEEQKTIIAQQVAELEMKALKAQMNPHFVFNSLSSIQESIVHGKTEAASKYLGKFSKLIRMVLEQSDKKTITLQEEINYLTLYLELESFRFDNFSFTINSERIIDASFLKIPAMLVQPYVENAIKHGLSHKQGDKKLAIEYVDYSEDVLQVTITDNGIGRQQSAIINQNREASHQSMGMKITSERLLLLQQKNASVVIDDVQDEQGNIAGTKVIVHIPLEK